MLDTINNICDAIGITFLVGFFGYYLYFKEKRK